MKLLFSGCTGVGKSTLIDKLIGNKKISSCSVYSDPFLPNPFLSNAYLYGEKFFQSEMFFFKEFLKIQQQITLDSHSLIIQERSIYECVSIFCKQLMNEGNISVDEYQLFDDLLAALGKWLRPPDRIIYLSAKPELIYQRIKGRQRAFENTLDLDFVKNQYSLYENWISAFSNSKGIPVLQIDAEKNMDDNIEMIYNFLEELRT